ncbi:ABC transporter substrate-binding protein [Planotetraspora kaengkrachanensis]|uniref:ABC transporter substrate-binding protein n=1 Tax=Planotetraspora kaengkrachanensis TaxID=575193 RepID=A0A8J3M256_9ACTN|nr:PhnD/SsuA/transferrin family substrate-binding protein [Planotetraspora kaengkrachanensis]GIG77964.1 ABC transporter substrate-binding protein [Planotetraspora kaengkrachanensis]
MTRHLVVGAFSPSVLLRVSRRTGLLAEHDLDVEERPVPSSPAQFRALIDGELDVALTSPDNVVAYRFDPGNPLRETADVRIVSAIDRGLGLGVYARPGIESAADLKGAIVGVDVPGSGFAFGLYALLESLGLDRGDYEIATLGSTPRRLEAMLAGGCDATMLNAGNELRAEAAGSVRLGRLVDVCRPYLGTVVSVAGDRKRPLADALAAVLLETAREIRAGHADQVTVDEAVEALRLPEALAVRYLERLKDPEEGLVADGVADLESMETIVGLRRRYMPALVDGTDVLAAALDPSGGLIDPPAATGR